MRICLVGALVCGMGAGVVQGEVVQYTFEGELVEGQSEDYWPYGRIWSWSLWIDSSTEPTTMNEHTAEYEAMQSQLTIGSMTFFGPSTLFLTNDFKNPIGETADFVGIEFSGELDEFQIFDFSAGMVGEFGLQLIDSTDLITESRSIDGMSAPISYEIRGGGQEFVGYTQTLSIQVTVPAPGSLGSLAMAGVVGARRRR